MLTPAVAYFRATVANYPDDPGVQSLVDELSLKSDEFDGTGLATTSRSVVGRGAAYHHPTLGALRLRYRTFAVTGTEGLTLYMVSAAPGSRDAPSARPPEHDRHRPRGSITASPLSRADD